MNILIKPIITEKASEISEDRNVFTFIVDKRANKLQIKDAVESVYGVSVEKVRTVIVGPKRTVRYTKGGVISGKLKGYKKAMVQIAEGDSIDFFSNI